MKTLKTLLLFSLLTGLSCSDEVEKKGADFRAQIAGKPWTANRVAVSAALSGERAEVKQLTAFADDGSAIEVSFELLGLTPTQLNSSFREQTTNFTAFAGTYNSPTGTVTLNWTTSSEENVWYFDVLRSYDNFYFEAIDAVYGHGTTNSPNSYYWSTWVNTEANVVYFKLRVIDNINNNQYSPTVMIKLKSGASFVDEFGRRFHGYDGNIDLTSYDAKGRVLSGTFSFKYLDANGAERSVTNGHFDRVTY
jgi:hypothetical protein